jgi:carbonic anhydrase
MFDDILSANARYAASFRHGDLGPAPTRRLAVLTCIDTRLEPHSMLGLEPGEVHLLRNAGARVTEDVLRGLIVAVNLLGVERVCIVHHTRCRLCGTSNEELRSQISDIRGADATSWDFAPFDSHQAALEHDVGIIRACALLPADLHVGGFLYDVDTGMLAPLP